MKKILTLILLFCFCSFSNAVSTYGGHLFGKGSFFCYSFIMSPMGLALLVTIKSENKAAFPEKPTLQFVTSDGGLIQLDGRNGNTELASGAIAAYFSSGNGTIRDMKRAAIFPITPKQVNMLANGIKSLHLTVLPNNYYLSFDSKAKYNLGVQLYNEYNKDNGTK